MNEAANLLQSGLSVLLVPILLGARALRKKFAIDPEKPTLPEAIIYALMGGLGLGLAYAQHSVNPLPAMTVVDLWWVQGLLFFGALIVADIGVDATSTKTAHAAEAIRAANPKE